MAQPVLPKQGEIATIKMDLSGLITAVPELMKWLVSKVSAKSLTHLCLVSKPVSKAVMRHVTRCTMELHGRSDQPPIFATLVENSHLQAVKFIFKHGGLHYQAQLNSLLTMLEHALSNTSIIRLDIKKVSECDIAAPLATACPRLRHLIIGKHVTRGLLASFGESCPELCSLTAARHFKCDDVRDFHLLLPRLSQLQLATLQRMQLHYRDEFDQPSCLELLSCPTLTSISMEDCLSDRLWAALPDGLVELLCCSNDQDQKSMARKTLHQLRHVTLTNNEDGACFWARLVMNVLRPAPQLERLSLVTPGRAFTPLSLPWIVSSCNPHEVQFIHSIHQAVVEGLSIDGGVNFWLCGKPQKKKAFIAALHSMPTVNGVYLEAVNTADAVACSRALQLFPDLTSYALNSHRPVTLSKLLPQLAIRNNLQRLALITKHGRYNTQQLASLIPSLKSLHTLHLHHTDSNLSREVRTSMARQDKVDLLQLFPNLDIFVSIDRAVANGPDADADEDTYSDPEDHKPLSDVDGDLDFESD